MSIVGVDEAGRGALAGPVCAAAVILSAEADCDALTDSKVLTPKRRAQLEGKLKGGWAADWCVAWASAQEVDEINVLQASLLAMSRAIAGITSRYERIEIDGLQVPDIPAASRGKKIRATPKADLYINEVSAASILAKVARDEWMKKISLEHPEYGFCKHKGYPTQAHRDALQQFGPCKIHRNSFAPVRELCQ